MILPAGGMDVCYIDESVDPHLYVMSAVTVPFLRQVDGTWTIVWEDQFQKVREWRRLLRSAHGIPATKELHGSKMLSGRGRYLRGEHQLNPTAAASAYRFALSELGFLPEAGIITVIGRPGRALYGHSRLEAVLVALLQRMRTAAEASRRVGMVFFDEGHGEYRKLYRKARAYLPTGSSRGDWGGGQLTRNLPLTNFTKDANFKESHHCYFTQLADLVSYAALLKFRGERGALTPKQQRQHAQDLYTAIPVRALNTRASRTDALGIVRL